jgi:hypothetical protein
VIFSFILRAKSLVEKECYSFKKLNIGKGREEGGKLSKRCLLLRLAALGMGKQSKQAIFSMTSSHAYTLHMLSICIHQSITRDNIVRREGSLIFR